MAGSVIELLGKGSCENRLKPVCDWLHQQMTSSVLGSRDMYDMYIWSISTDIYIIYIYIFFLYPNAPLLMWRPPISNAACNKQASLGWSGGWGGDMYRNKNLKNLFCQCMFDVVRIFWCFCVFWWPCS